MYRDLCVRLVCWLKYKPFLSAHQVEINDRLSIDSNLILSIINFKLCWSLLCETNIDRLPSEIGVI